MKKTLAILLACVMLAATFSIAPIIASADGVPSKVIVHAADGSTLTTLNATTTSYTDPAGGTAVWDPTTGTLTATDLSVGALDGDYSGVFTLVVKGTCNFERTDSRQWNIYADEGLVVKGDGTLNLKAATGKDGNIISRGFATFEDSVKVNIANTAAGSNTIRSAGQYGTAAITVKGSVKIAMNGKTGNFFQLNGADSSLVITENAVVDVTADGNFVAIETNDKTVTDPKAYVEISGNAKVTATAAKGAIFLKDIKQGKRAEFAVKGNAKADLTSADEVVYMAANTTGKVYFNVSDEASVKLTNTGTACPQALFTVSNAYVNITGGTVEMIAPNGNVCTFEKEKDFTLGDVQSMKSGADAATATTVSALDPAAKYFKVEVKELSDPPTAAPANVKASNVASTTATVSWDAANGATSYTLYMGGAEVAKNISGLSYDLTDLTPETEYKVQVTADNNGGSSPKSSEIKFTTTAIPVGAEQVTITLSDGSTVILNAGNLAYFDATNGKATLDIAAGTLTIENLKAKNISANGEKLTVVVKGTNTLENKEGQNLLYADEITVKGDGVLNLKTEVKEGGNALIKADNALTFDGSVTVNFASTKTDNNQTIKVNGKSGVAKVVIKGSAKLNMEGNTGDFLWLEGIDSSLVITENAVVNVKNPNYSFVLLQTGSQQVAEYVGTNKAYIEISGSAKVTATGCKDSAFRTRHMDGKNGYDQTKNLSEFVVKDNAIVEVSAKDRVILLDQDFSTGKSTFTVSGNASLKVTNVSNKAGIAFGGKGVNNFKLNGGVLEVSAPQSKAFSGTVTYDLGTTPVIAGADAASAVSVSAVDSTYKYVKMGAGVTPSNPNPGTGTVPPPTSDNILSVTAIVLAVSAVAVAAAVVLRKKSAQ